MKSVFNSLGVICAMLLRTEVDRLPPLQKAIYICFSDEGQRSTDDQISGREQSRIRIGRFFIYHTSFGRTRNPVKSSLSVVIGVEMAHASFALFYAPGFFLPASFMPLTYQAKFLNPNLIRIHDLFFFRIAFS